MEMRCMNLFMAVVAAALMFAAAGPCAARRVELVPSPAADYRWRDIGANLYSPSYQASYLYDDASVVVEFPQCMDSLFSGRLTAENLKPNFAYQMKLVGKPEGIWGQDGDDVTNERIGYTGRWWRVTPNPGNTNDADYEAHKDEPDYIFEGYLVFDFFVTGRLAAADVEFASSSSYHVLWWEHQRARGACDSPVKWSTVVGYATDPAYDEDVGPTEVGVYGEIERLCYGETRLPPGRYNCRFALTEESFHQTGEGEGGWATVLVCDTLDFDIDCASSIPGGQGGATVLLRSMRPNPFREKSVIEFALERAGPAALFIYDLRGRLVARLGTGDLGAGRHRLSWDGTDLSGGPAPAGIYFYRLEAGAGTAATGKVILLH
jgi:hypothetical protein